MSKKESILRRPYSTSAVKKKVGWSEAAEVRSDSRDQSDIDHQLAYKVEHSKYVARKKRVWKLQRHLEKTLSRHMATPPGRSIITKYIFYPADEETTLWSVHNVGLDMGNYMQRCRRFHKERITIKRRGPKRDTKRDWRNQTGL